MAENVTTQTIWTRGRIILGGLIAAGLIGGGIRLADFNSAGKENPSQNSSAIVADWLNVFVTATGSTTLKYPAVCIANPLVGLNLGSGTVVRLSYQVGNNPTGVGGDIGFTKGCGNSYGSGADLIDNTCTSTGCVSFYTTGTAAWNGADKIKLTLRGNPTSSYTARIRLQYEDIFGE